MIVRTGGFRRLLAIFGGLLAALCVPLALSGPTAWLLLPAHLAFTVLVSVGALAEGFTGRPERARLWGLLYLVATLLVAATLELAAQVRGSWTWYWGPPWLGVLIWGWVPPLVAGVSGVVGELRADRRTARVVRRRKAELRR